MALTLVELGAIHRQRVAHFTLANGPLVVPAAESGPLASYNRAQTLDYLVQLIRVYTDGFHLPKTQVVGLLVNPAEPRVPIDARTRKEYPELIEKLTAAGAYTTDEIADALDRLDETVAAGVILDPATAENTTE